MNEIVERCLNTLGMMQGVSRQYLDEHRDELTSYIEELEANGEADADRLAVSGLTFLRRNMKRETSRAA
ncbi:hypothetical protein V1291_004521 [Nitrobacteraceae bacterium AZCC 1564]